MAGSRVAMQAFEVGTQIGGRLVTQVGLFFEQFADDRIESWRNRRIQAFNWRGIAM